MPMKLPKWLNPVPVPEPVPKLPTLGPSPLKPIGGW
jgi:hypothetical protein